MNFRAFHKTATCVLIVWIVLLTIATVISPYLRIMHDNSTIVEIGIREGMLSVHHDVVYDDEIRSLANSTILGISAYGPPKLSELFSRWKVFLGVDHAVFLDSQRTRQWVDGIALWLIALAGTLFVSLIRFFRRRLKLRPNRAESLKPRPLRVK